MQEPLQQHADKCDNTSATKRRTSCFSPASAPDFQLGFPGLGADLPEQEGSTLAPQPLPFVPGITEAEEAALM